MLTNAQVVLAIGNALNGSTFRGGARGFQLDALLKVYLPQLGFMILLLNTLLDERNKDGKSWNGLPNASTLSSQGFDA